MSKHVGEKCGKWADGDRTDGRTETRRETRRETRADITISQYVPSEDGRIKINQAVYVEWPYVYSHTYTYIRATTNKTTLKFLKILNALKILYKHCLF